MKMLGLVVLGLLLLVPVQYAAADLVFTTDIQVSGTGLGAVNTLVTVHDPGGPGTQNGTESGCINQDGSFSPCLGGVEGGDNTAINQVITLDTNNNFAAVINIAETGQDKSATLTALYLTFCSTTDSSCYTAFWNEADKVLTQGGSEGTGLGNSGFTFALDDAQFAIVQGLPGSFVTISGGLQFLNGSTDDGNDTLHVIQFANGVQVPEPSSLLLLGSGLVGVGVLMRRKTA
jgi:hypothetical protein